VSLFITIMVFDVTMLNISPFIVFIITFVFVWNWYRRPPRYPPGPLGFPVLGVLPFLSNRPENKFLDWSKRYGPIISVSIGWQKWLVLNEYDVTMEALVRNRLAFHGRPLVEFFIRTTVPLGIAFAPGGVHWKTLRKFGTNGIKAVGLEIMEKKTNIEIQYFIEEIRGHKGKSFNIQEPLTHAVANVVSSFCLGQRFDRSNDSFNQLIRSLMHQGHVAANWRTMLLTFLPFLCDVWPFTKHMDESITNVRTLNGIIRHFVEEQSASFDGDEVRNMVDAFLMHSRNSVDENVITDDKIIGFFSDMFLAGTETITSQLRWGFLIMMKHQDCQNKVRREIDDVIGRHGTVKLKHRSIMPYTCAVVHELFRFRTVVPLSLPRMNVADVTVGGYRIPKGTNVIMNIWALHNDDCRWREPERFIPERHLNADGKFMKPKNVLPFGVGARSCIAEHLARNKIFLFLVSTLKNFTLSVPNGDSPSLDAGSNGTIFIPSDYNIVAQYR
uniref:Uncharacterized protein n=1 Tax=Ciona intestinalis TaxID=7719 RepID=H2XMC8_CIOIN